MFHRTSSITLVGCLLLACASDSEPAQNRANDTTAVDAVSIDGQALPSDAGEGNGSRPFWCDSAAMGSRWTFDGLAKDGPYFAGFIDLTAMDPDRDTDAHGIFPQASGRTVSIRVWYPAEKGILGDLTPQQRAPLARSDGPYPLLVHSHGFSSNNDELAYAGEWMATRGWVFAAIEFPLTNLSTSGGPQLVDIANQPADVSFVIDELVGRTLTSSDLLFRAIDTERIALSGVSLGGLTTLLATYHRDWRDPRVKAVVSIAGPTGFLHTPFYSFVDLPALLLYGDTDAIVDYAAHALPARERAPAGTLLLTLAAASHTGFVGFASFFESSDNPDSVGCDAIAGQLPDNDLFLQAMSDPATGIEPVPLPTPCLADPLPYAMRPSRQHLLTRLSVLAWLELQLGTTASRRATACDFITSVLSAEGDVTVR